MENHHCLWENPLSMVIFNSYVKLTEGNDFWWQRDTADTAFKSRESHDMMEAPDIPVQSLDATHTPQNPQCSSVHHGVLNTAKSWGTPHHHGKNLYEVMVIHVVVALLSETPQVESMLFKVAWSEDCGDTQLAYVERCLRCLRCDMQPHSLERHGRSWPCQVRVCCILVTRPWTRVSGPEMAWGYGWHSVMVYG